MDIGKGRDKHKNDPHPNPVLRAEQINYVWEQKRLGATQAWIGETMPGGRVSQSTVSKLLKEGRQLHAPPAVEDERLVALQRNEEQYSHLAQALARTTDVDAVIKLVTAMDRVERTRHDLLGIKAPKRIDLTSHEVDTTDLELIDIINAAKAERLTREAEIRGAVDS